MNPWAAGWFTNFVIKVIVVRTLTRKLIDPITMYSCAKDTGNRAKVKSNRKSGSMKTPTPITRCKVTIPMIRQAFTKSRMISKDILYADVTYFRVHSGMKSVKSKIWWSLKLFVPFCVENFFQTSSGPKWDWVRSEETIQKTVQPIVPTF